MIPHVLRTCGHTATRRRSALWRRTRAGSCLLLLLAGLLEVRGCISHAVIVWKSQLARRREAGWLAQPVSSSGPRSIGVARRRLLLHKKRRKVIGGQRNPPSSCRGVSSVVSLLTAVRRLAHHRSRVCVVSFDEARRRAGGPVSSGSRTDHCRSQGQPRPLPLPCTELQG